MEKIILSSLDLITNGVVISDPQKKDNPIVYSNKAFTDITGYEKNEVVGINCRFLQGNEKKTQEHEKIREAIKQKKPISVILKNYKKNGQSFWNELYISPINYEGKIYFIGIQNDVTKRKIAEDKLKKYMRELEEIVDERTKNIINANQKLIKEINEHKEAQKKIIQLNDKLIEFGRTIKKTKSKKSKLSVKENIVRELLLNSSNITIQEISNKLNIPKSTISTIRKRLLDKSIEEIIFVNLKIFNFISLVIFGNERIKELPSNTIISAIGKDNGFYITASKDWSDFNKRNRTSGLTNPKIHHFDTKESEIKFFDTKNESQKVGKTMAKVLYGMCKYKNTKKASEMIELSLQSTIKYNNELNTNSIILKKNTDKISDRNIILLKKTEGNFFTIKDKDKEFGIDVSDEIQRIDINTESILNINETEFKIDFSEAVKINHIAIQ